MRLFKKRIFEKENTQKNEGSDLEISETSKFFNEEDELAKLDQPNPYQKMNDQNFFTTDATQETNNPNFRQFQQNTTPSQKQTENITKREIELILSKLDTIKANIENINQRITNLENQAVQQEKIRKKVWQ